MRASPIRCPLVRTRKSEGSCVDERVGVSRFRVVSFAAALIALSALAGCGERPCSPDSVRIDGRCYPVGTVPDARADSMRSEVAIEDVLDVASGDVVMDA